MKNPFLRLGSFIVIVGALLGLGFIGKLVFERYFAPQPAAALLPADQVAAYIEVDLTDEDARRWDGIFADDATLQLGALRAQLGEWLGTGDFPAVTHGAWALLADQEQVLLVADFPAERLQELAEKYGSEKIGDITSLQQRALSWAPAGDFTVFARDAATLENVLRDEGPKLAADADFQTISSGLPAGVAFVYFDGPSLLGETAADENVENLLWLPIARLLASGGASVALQDDGILTRTKTVYDDSLADTASQIFSRVKASRHDMLQYFPESAAIYFESSDLQSDWRDWEQILQNEAPTLGALWQRQKSYWEQGTSLSLADDVLQLADGAYALGAVAVKNGSGSTLVPVAVVQNDPTFLQEKMDYFEDVLLSRIPAMYPESRDMQLADGETASVLHVGAELERDTQQIGDVEFVRLHSSNLPFDIVYAIFDDVLLLTFDEQAMIDTLAAIGTGDTLDDNSDFQKGLAKIDGMQTDIVFVDLEEVSDRAPAQLQPLLSSFSNLTGGQNLLDFESLSAYFLQK